jgi:hypothetical protein
MASAYGGGYQIIVGRRKPAGSAKKRLYARWAKQPFCEEWLRELKYFCNPEE